MTGVSELRTVEVVPATPDQLRVSVLGGRTQLDVALPADVPVAAFLPELAQLIRSRDDHRDADVADRDDRRTFWVLSRIDGGAALAPDETLRTAGVSNGELLLISARRALSPPMLYDDVVDAAARLNRAAYAAWNPAAAKVMAFAGLWLGAAVWVIFLLADALSPNRTEVLVGAVFTVGVLMGAAGVAHRVLNLDDAAAAAGIPALAITITLGWVIAAPHGAAGLAVACAVLLVLTGGYYRIVGTGHWAYLAAALVATLGGLAFLGYALGGSLSAVATGAATISVLGCLATPTLTARLARFPVPKAQKDGAGADPFTEPEAITSGAVMPSAEQVWARVRAVSLTNAGLLAGWAVVVVIAATVLLKNRTELSAFIFALACAAVLGLRSRRTGTWPERVALGVPAVALTVAACVVTQSGAPSVRLAGVGVLLAVAVLATLAGLVAGRGRRGPTAAAYVEYVMVAVIVPLALWPLGVYDRLGLW